MVVFTCNHCGDSLQKPRVEKHYNIQCRKPKSLTCVDCFKDFKDEEYVVHTKCITEEERYAAKGSIPGGIVKKGDIKQESWTDMIKSIVDNENDLKPSLKNLFHTISNYTNVPRKKNKFINFLKNSLGNRVNFRDIESAWDLIEKHKSEQSNSVNQEKTASVQNGTKHKLTEDNDEVPAKKKKKLKMGENEADQLTANQELETNGHCNGDMKKKNKKKSKDALEEEKCTKNEEIVVESLAEVQTEIFSFKSTILGILNEKGNISVKKLQKKVLNAYVKQTGNDCTEKTVKKYNKKLKKLPNVVINNDVVTLQTPTS